MREKQNDERNEKGNSKSEHLTTDPACSDDWAFSFPDITLSDSQRFVSMLMITGW
jgi:hypothetical protein